MRDVSPTFLIYDRGTISGIVKIRSRETLLGEGNLYCIIQRSPLANFLERPMVAALNRYAGF